MEQNLENMENFLKIDLEIKEKIAELSPDNIDFEDNESKIEYSDKIFKGIKDLQYSFSNLMRSFDLPSELVEEVQNKLKNIEEHITYAGTNSHILKELYSSCFSDMSKTFVDKVNKNFYGYLLEKNVGEVISNSNTVNELLHGVHSYVMNNEEILQSLNVIEKKNNNNEYSNITLYGRDETLAREIYDNLNNIENTSNIDILSLKNKIFMMVRDKGHALTLEIDSLDENLLVKYFIPKICNVQMVNKLKGITKVKDTSKPTNGMFETTRESLSNEILDFIDKVPTDMDMEFVKSTPKIPMDKINISELTNNITFKNMNNSIEILQQEILNKNENIQQKE